jgi:hypothetical protein
MEVLTSNYTFSSVLRQGPRTALALQCFNNPLRHKQTGLIYSYTLVGWIVNPNGTF